MMTDDNDCTVSHDARRILGDVPAIPGESAASYDELLTRMTETLKPGDLIEEVWVRDIVDMTWEILRLRRLNAGMLAGGARHGLDNLLSDLGAPGAYDTSKGWAAADRLAAERVNGTLAAAGLSMHAVMARTLSENIRDIETIERITMTLEARRNASLEQIDRRQAKLALRLRRTIEEVEAVELKRVENAPAMAQA
jgi:hypothetical protein